MNFNMYFNIKIIILFLLMIFIALMSGYIASTGQALFVVILAGIFIAFLLLSQPLSLFIMTGVMALLIAGSIKYFIPGFDRIWWVVYGMATLLYIPAILGAFKKPQRPQNRYFPIYIIVVLFLLIILLSFIISQPPLLQVIVAVKSIFLFGAVWAFLAFYPISSRVIKLWLIIMLVIALFQVFPVLYQYVFVRSERLVADLGTVEASDSVVGTFGGSKESGGLSAVLAVYLVSIMMVLLSFYRDRLLSRVQVFMLLFIILIPLLLIEVKAVFVFIPIGLIVLYRKDIVRNPFKTFLWFIALLCFLGLILFSYQTFHWSMTGRDFWGNIEHSFLYSFQESSEGIRGESGAVTRRQALELWYDYGIGLEMFIGHGLGASRSVGAVLGEVARLFYPMQIDVVGMAIILWDLGILGAITIIGMFYFNYKNAGIASQSHFLPLWQRSLARALQPIVVLLLITLFYRPDIPYAVPMMFFLMSCFGLISWFNSEERRIFSEKNP